MEWQEFCCKTCLSWFLAANYDYTSMDAQIIECPKCHEQYEIKRRGSSIMADGVTVRKIEKKP